MKLQTLPVKRRPVPKGLFRRLNAVTRNRKQRVAAAAVPASEIEESDGGSKISRALTIIFLIHIVAIGLIFFHQRFLDGRPAETVEAPKSKAAADAAAVVVPAAKPSEDLPRLSSGDTPYVAKAGDNYARIAAAHGVDEAELRQANNQVEICPGRLLKIPPRRIVAVEPPEVAAIREQTPVVDDRGLVEAVDVTHAPKARLVRPAGEVPEAFRAVANADVPKASGKSHTVQPGESVWRIANRYKVTQDALMRANGISDARKMKAGMKLVIPQG
jgi:LysM repeat protein